MGMGMIGKVVGGALAGKILQKALAKRSTTQTTGQYVPRRSLDTVRGTVVQRGTSVLDKAGNFYRENPKLVHSVGSAILAVALASYAKSRQTR
jgi:hypothetical protein